MFQSTVIANSSVIVLVTGKKPSDKAESKSFFLGKKKKKWGNQRKQKLFDNLWLD